jgi:Raf kinase inhibitor-like YbhB/YbcL family protein
MNILPKFLNTVYLLGSTLEKCQSFFYSIFVKQLSISSPAFTDKGNIPLKYTCDGEDVNPPLTFENIPEETKSLTLLVEDPDSLGKTWLHWALYNIDPKNEKIHEDSKPLSSSECMTDFGNIGYGGPCPAKGVHRYVFKLFALDDTLDLTEDSKLDEIYSAMENHIIDQAQMTGLYTRD